MRATSATLYCLLFAMLAACSAAPPFDAKAVAVEWATYMQRDYTLRPGDKLAIQVTQLEDMPESELIQEIIITPTGTIDLVRVGAPIQVAGRSVAAARTLVLTAYQGVFANPRVNLSLLEASAQSVYVMGEVGSSGPVAYQPGLTMTQAIASAGSFGYTAKETDVRILRINLDGTQRTFRVNLSRILLDEEPDFLLLPGDVVYCQTSTIADLGNLVDLYVRRLLPFSLSGPSVGSIQ